MGSKGDPNIGNVSPSLKKGTTCKFILFIYKEKLKIDIYIGSRTVSQTVTGNKSNSKIKVPFCLILIANFLC